MTRSEFERRFAAERGVTVESLGRQGWHSYLSGGEWTDICAPDDLPAEKRREILAGCFDAARFGDTPPTNGAGG
jgi:hypothetical protein